MSAIINLIMLVLNKFGFTESAKTPGVKPSKIYMKRAVFVAALALSLWAIIEPESLAMRLEHASEVLPGWFTGLLSTVFAGVFL